MASETSPARANQQFVLDARDRGATWTRPRLSGALWLAAWGLLCCSLAGFLGRLWWVLDLTSHFRVQYLVVSSMFLLLVLILRRWTLLLPLLFSVFVNLYLICPFYVGGSAAELPGSTLRVMTINVNAGNRQSRAVLDAIAECHPDVLFVLEYNEFWQQSLESLESAYRYTRQVPREDNFGMAVYSRWPLSQAEIWALPGGDVPAIEVKLQLSEQTCTVLGAHVLPPVSAAASDARNEQLAALARRTARVSDPCVLVGDLNCTPWSPHFRRLLEISALRDSRRGFGVQATWPAQLPAMMIPIDHCLVSTGVDVFARFVTADCGSDHRGLVIDLAAPGRTGGQ